MGTVRLLPLVAISALCLFFVKVGSVFIEGSTILSGYSKAQAGNSTPLPNLNETVRHPDFSPDSLITGAAGDKGKNQNKKVAQMKSTENSKIISGPEISSTKSEFAILQSLSKRRKKLDEREKQLILQRNLLKAAEKKLESRIAQIKTMEERFKSGADKQKTTQEERYRKLVEMYSKMKPADAAKIFNRLDLEVLASLVQHMNSRAMASILSAMDPVKAERLTLKIANQGKSDPMSTKSLPKIQNKR